MFYRPYAARTRIVRVMTTNQANPLLDTDGEPRHIPASLAELKQTLRAIMDASIDPAHVVAWSEAVARVYNQLIAAQYEAGVDMDDLMWTREFIGGVLVPADADVPVVVTLQACDHSGPFAGVRYHVRFILSDGCPSRFAVETCGRCLIRDLPSRLSDGSTAMVEVIDAA